MTYDEWKTRPHELGRFQVCGWDDNQTKGTTMTDEMANKMLDTAMNFMAASDALQRVVAAEGTPAIKDVLHGFEVALDAAMEAHIRITRMASDELARLRAAVQS